MRARTVVGWSEIASYFEVSIRTAQTWGKKHGLRVYRLESGNRGFVTANEIGLEEWLQERQNHESYSENRFDAFTLILIAILIVVAILAGLGWYCCLSC